MLKEEKWQEHVNDLDSDGCGLLHVLAMSSSAGSAGSRRKYTSKEARDIIQAIQNAGGSLNLLSGVTKGFVHGSAGGIHQGEKRKEQDELNFLYLDAHHETPVWLAAYYGNYPVVKVLINEGACPHAPNSRGVTPVMVARKSLKSKFHHRLRISEEDRRKTLEFLQNRMKLEEEEI
jgi:ankyrin repeat protein